MDPSARPAAPDSRGVAAPGPPLITTIVASPQRSVLRTIHPGVLRLKVVGSQERGTTKVLAGWSDPEAMTTRDWGATIGQITCLLADDMALDPNVEFPAVPLAGLYRNPAEDEHPEPGIEVLFDPRAVARMEVVVDRVVPDVGAFLWLFGALRGAAALATWEKEACA